MTRRRVVSAPQVVPLVSRLVRHGPAAVIVLVLVCAMAALDPATAKKSKKTDKSWPEIPTEELSLTGVSQDPEADAVVLLNERHGRITRKADDFVNVLRYHWRLKVLTDRGNKYGEVHIPAQKYSRVSNLEARTIKADGSIVALAPDQIFEKVVWQVGNVKFTEHVFNFPAVEPGVTLEYRYERHDNFIFFLDPWFFEGSEFTLVSRVSQAFPAGMSYSILCGNCPSAEPTLAKYREGKEKGQRYSLELRDLPGYRDEILMPPRRDVSPRLEMVLNTWKRRFSQAIGRADRFFVDWESVARYVWYHYERAINRGESEIKPLVVSWVQGISDPQEKMHAVLAHVRGDFRYLPYTSVIGLTRPIEKLVASKTADNEEKAVLLLAALKAIDVEAYPALVAGKHRGDLNPKFFSLTQFSHTIVAVSQPGGGHAWLDPTVAYAPADFVPWKDSGASALLIEGNQGTVVDLPLKTEPSKTVYRVSVTPRTDGKADVELHAEYNGEDAIDMREDLSPESESGRKSYLEEWVEDRLPGATLKSQSLENLDQNEKPLIINLSIESPGLVTVAEDVMAVRSCVFSCRHTNPISRAARTHPFYVDRGWNTEEIVTIQSPPGMAVGPMPPARVSRSSICRHSFSCMTRGEDAARCMRLFTARRNRWPASQNASVRSMFDEIIQSDRTTVAFERPAAGGGGE